MAAQTKLPKLPQFNVEQFRTEAVKPLYAVAGATELAVDLARGYATEAQKAYQQRLNAVQSGLAALATVDYRDPKALSDQAREVLNGRIDELIREARKAQARFEARLAELQKDARAYPGRAQSQVNEAVEELTETYADLARRGEKFVAAVRKDGVRAVTAVKKAPAQSTVARRERAVSAAKKAPARSTASRSTTRKSTAKKAPAKKSTARKSTARKSTAKKSTSTSSTGS